MRNDVEQNLFSQLESGMEHFLFYLPRPFNNIILDEQKIQSLYDYRCVFALGDPLLIISCGKNMAFAIELQKPNKNWFSLERSQLKIELPANTLLLAERVQEHFGDGGNRTRMAIYVIDAYFIANENLLYQNGRPTIFMDRYRMLKIFEKAINKPARHDLVPIRISEQLRLEQMDMQFEKLCSPDNLGQIDNKRPLWLTNMEVETRPKVPVRGLWIFKFVQSPWTILLSKSRQVKYFHNYNRRESIPEAPADSSHVASLRSMLEHSFYWDFNNPENAVPKSRFITLIQDKNRENQPHNHH